MKDAEMRERNPEELERLLAEWREELFKLNIQAMTGQVEKSGRKREIRKNIARALTILSEYSRGYGGIKRESNVS